MCIPVLRSNGEPGRNDFWPVREDLKQEITVNNSDRGYEGEKKSRKAPPGLQIRNSLFEDTVELKPKGRSGVCRQATLQARVL